VRPRHTARHRPRPRHTGSPTTIIIIIIITDPIAITVMPWPRDCAAGAAVCDKDGVWHSPRRVLIAPDVVGSVHWHARLHHKVKAGGGQAGTVVQHHVCGVHSEAAHWAGGTWGGHTRGPRGGADTWRNLPTNTCMQCKQMNTARVGALSATWPPQHHVGMNTSKAYTTSSSCQSAL
jgi:hypothetical protein